MKCSATIFSGGFYGGSSCGNTAKYPADAPKWCGTHEPVRRKARQDERDAKFNARMAVGDRSRRRRELVRIVGEAAVAWRLEPSEVTLAALCNHADVVITHDDEELGQ